MARVTVEDCIDKVPNHFELVILAAYRARQLCSGASPEIPKLEHKNTVVALGEISKNKLSLDKLREGVSKSLNSHANYFETDEELIQILAEEQEKKFEESLTAGSANDENLSAFVEETDLDLEEDSEVEEEASALEHDVEEFPAEEQDE